MKPDSSNRLLLTSLRPTIMANKSNMFILDIFICSYRLLVYLHACMHAAIIAAKEDAHYIASLIFLRVKNSRLSGFSFKKKFL